MIYKKMFMELMICAVKQGYFIKIEDKKYIDLITYFKLKKICEKES